MVKFSKLEMEDFKRKSQQGDSCWKWEVEKDGVGIVIYGNAEEPYEKNLVMANEKLHEISKHIKVAEDRIDSWFYKKIKGNIGTTTFTEITGNTVNDVYSNYGVKFVKKEGVYPIAIEFYIS